MLRDIFMNLLSVEQVDRLDEFLAAGIEPLRAFPEATGGSSVGDGAWRLFSDEWPTNGIRHWNQGSAWKAHWKPFISPMLLSFGEDVFGNQLMIGGSGENVLLWNHENGECTDLWVGPTELLRTVIDNGLRWIDFYSDRSLDVAGQFSPVPLDMHLHWVTPLFLGGQVAASNISLIERDAHLVGHAQIWSQLSRIS